MGSKKVKNVEESFSLTFEQQSELIEEVKNYPILWDTNSDVYKKTSRAKRAAQWNTVATTLMTNNSESQLQISGEQL